ncbi:type III-A CRISPR-associated RAMP protein Csm5 [Prosthecochloris sp. N3]|uniref:CRISPR system Cms protein Csm5 n=1 Tax=Prosthecochloris ethylica TaxID=2743976 RepID=A0ABR9XT15_9CHLB|nr:type III-A CRISPR-associated RAMP protein Csm5 [Prosthecochloris ethylica]MBF0586926.1 type III-A CRISPR-associated RAMP protein Csm5 [Prosthecochloris ethylica]MBF0637197.1 type III-A CRISPR-associated RAMP protein Csm5 [Prosthecochloris ethylica]NUK48205.1 type III-A CRISPR-associated RAMP protein Csm5 [Prosthecochloris ethylica]
MTLSPLHIGKGTSLQVSDYTIINGRYVRIDVDRAFSLVSEYGKVGAVLHTLEQLLDEFSKTGDNARKVEIRRELDFLRLCSREDTELKEAVEHRLDEISLYSIPSFLPERITGRLIDEQLKDADREVYVPGTTIKGALRTALLAHVIPQLETGEKEDIIHFISKQTRNKPAGRDSRLMKILDDRLVQHAFHCGKKWRNSSNVTFKDLKYDLLRFLVVQDSSALSPEESLGVIYPKQYTLSSIEAGQDSRNPCEAILPSVTFSFDLDVRVEELFLLASKLNFSYQGSRGIRDTQGNISWVDIEKKTSRLFNLDLNTLDRNKLDEFRGDIVAHVLECCRKFYREVLWHDRNWLEHARKRGGSEQLFEYLDQFYEQLDHIMEQGTVVMKTAGGAGFHSKTVMLSMLLDDVPQNNCFRDTMISLMKKFEIGKPPDHKGAYFLNTDTFPTSRPLSTNDPLEESFGWVMVRQEPLTAAEQNLLDSAGRNYREHILVSD